MRAFSRSYGLISIFTVSPAAILMKFLRSFPEMCARTSWPLASFTLNIVPGSTATTLPSTSIALPSDMGEGSAKVGGGPLDHGNRLGRSVKSPL